MLYSTRTNLILFCSPQWLYTLLKAVAWKKIIRSTTAAPQGIIIVIIFHMVKSYLVTSARRCRESQMPPFSFKLNTRSCWFLLISCEEQLVCLIFYHRKYLIEVFFCGLKGRFYHSFGSTWNCIHSGSLSYLNRVHVKFPHKQIHKKHRQSGRLFLTFKDATGTVWRVLKLYAFVQVCVSVCMCM